MTSSILATKLYIPPTRPGLVQRSRLEPRLDAICTVPLTLISAPAGFGKSTLLGSWIQSRGSQVPTAFRTAWLSLDAEDDDPARFWEYFLAAVQTWNLESIHYEQVQILLQGQAIPPYQPILTDLINQLAAFDQSLVLVLDDLHLIQSPYIHEGLAFLVEHLPPQVHLVLSTRSDPPLPLGRWRVHGILNEIRSSDLRFNFEESNIYLNLRMGLRLEGQQIAELEKRTEGWIAGLQMAAISLRDQDATGIAKFISGFSGQHHLILDYLTDEVLQRQPEYVQQFLLKTSILGQLYAPVCDAVIDNSLAPAGHSPTTVQLLEQLEHNNLFIIPLDENRNWYRYHHLFRELLLIRLKETFPDQIPGLHRRAVAWYEANGYPFEAMQHALAVQDSTLAADVIERTIRRPATWSTGNIARMFEVIEALPQPVIDSRPWLRIYFSGVMYVGGFLETADQMLAEVEEQLQPSVSPGDEQNQLRLFTHAYRAYYAAVRGDVRLAVQQAKQVLQALPADHMAVLGHALSTLGWANFLTGNVVEASHLLDQAIQHQSKKGARFTQVTWLCNLANVQMVQGRLREAAQTCEEAIQIGTSENQPSPTVGLAKIYLAHVLYEWNRLEEAEEQIRAGIDMTQKGGITPNFGLAHALLAAVCQARGKFKEANLCIQTGLQIAHNSQLTRYISLVSAAQARLWLAQGEIELALDWKENFQSLPKSEYLREFEELTLAQVLIRKNKLEDARAHLDAIISSAVPAERMGRVIEALILRSVALWNQAGRRNEAQETLRKAVKLAAPEGYRRIFLDQGQPMLEQLAGLKLDSAPDRSFLAQLLASFSAADQAALVDQAESIEPLTGRELEILRLMAAGMSNGEIAKKLHVTLNTMRAHTTHIFGKLGVHNRTEAAAKARELRIL